MGKTIYRYRNFPLPCLSPGGQLVDKNGEKIGIQWIFFCDILMAYWWNTPSNSHRCGRIHGSFLKESHEFPQLWQVTGSPSTRLYHLGNMRKSLVVMAFFMCHILLKVLMIWWDVMLVMFVNISVLVFVRKLPSGYVKIAIENGHL
jgi:hypothetical protein